MEQKRIDQIAGVIAVALLVWFIIGLAESISSGFAGFWGGLPVWVIGIFVLGIVIHDLWAATFSKNR